MDQADEVASTGGGDWEFYRDDDGVRVVAEEIRKAGNSGYETKLIRAEVLNLLRAAVQGRLTPVEQVKQITSNPMLFELRWSIGDQYVPERLWRLYFTWWRNKGPLRWGLRFAEKRTNGTIEQISQAQNEDIDLAWTRLTVWLKRIIAGTV